MHAEVSAYWPWQNPPSESHWPFPHAFAQQSLRQFIGVSFGIYDMPNMAVDNRTKNNARILFMIVLEINGLNKL